MLKLIVNLLLIIIVCSIITNCSTSSGIRENVESDIECFEDIKITKPRIIGKTSSGGLGIPNSTQLRNVRDPNFNITGHSNDDKYGYTFNKPIFTGGKFPGGSSRQWLFLVNLRDHKGNPVYFERLGSVGRYNDPNGKNSGIIDAYYIEIKGLKKPIILYLSLYASTTEPIQIPKCFNYKETILNNQVSLLH